MRGLQLVLWTGREKRREARAGSCTLSVELFGAKTDAMITVKTVAGDLPSFATSG